MEHQIPCRTHQGTIIPLTLDAGNTARITFAPAQTGSSKLLRSDFQTDLCQPPSSPWAAFSVDTAPVLLFSIIAIKFIMGNKSGVVNKF